MGAALNERTITIAQWRRKRGHNPRFSVYDGREQLGLIFESRGIFSAVDPHGNLVAASTAFQIAANALTAMASS
jgi:hypothetical protein